MRPVGINEVIIEGDKANVLCFNGMNGKEHSFQTSSEIGYKLLDWMEKGQKLMIQDAVPELSADEREMCLSGINAEEWNEIFGSDEEE